MKKSDDDDNGQRPLGFFEVMGTVLWTALGVSNQKRRERDFRRGRGLHFAIAGAVYMLLLISGLIALVNYLARH